MACGILKPSEERRYKNMLTIIFTVSFIIFLALGIFTLFIAPHISEELQLKMVYPSAVSGIIVLIVLFVLPAIIH